MRRVPTVLSAALAMASAMAFAMSGCTPTIEPPRIVTSDHPELSGMEALLVAELEVDEAGCIYARFERTRLTLVWPRGYTVRGDRTSFEILDADDEVVARSGTVLRAGGGGVGPVDDDWEDTDCASGSIWLVGDIDPSSAVEEARSAERG
jgi:hypothetical protein